MQFGQTRFVKPGADTADITQGVVFMNAQQERAKPGACALRAGESSDDEFLPLQALEFYPGAASATLIRCVEPLAHQTLKAVMANAVPQVLDGGSVHLRHTNQRVSIFCEQRIEHHPPCGP